MAETNTPQVSDEDVSKILDTIKEIESGGNYSTKARGSSASGAYQFIDDTWKRFTSKYGVGTEYKKASEAPPEVQDEVAALKVRDILRQVGGDVSKVPLVWYTGNPQGRMTQDAMKANQGLSPDKYQQRWMAAFNKRQEAIPAAPAPIQETRTTDLGPTAAAPLDTLPENYRLALAANYLADTESDTEKSVADKAMEYLEQYTQAQEGGASNIKKALGSVLTDQGPNPFEILALGQKGTQEKKKVVPKMPVKFADGGLASKALIGNRQKLTQTDYDWLNARQNEFNAYNTAVDDYQRAVDAYNARVDAYNANPEGVPHPGEFTNPQPTVPTTTAEQYEARQLEAQNRAKRFYAARAAGLENIINPQKNNLSGMSFSFADGGEVGLGEDEARKKSQEMLFNLRASMGPVTGQFVPGAHGLDVRASTPFGPIKPFVDINPSDQEVTQVGATYGDMTPQGGYEVGVSQRAPVDTPQGKIRMPVVAQGAYRTPVGKSGTLEAQGYYVPRQGEMQGPDYGANLRYRMSFATGGDVDIAEQMTVGTLPQDQKPAGEVFRDVGQDLVRGTQYLPYDLAGMPVDIATMAMRPFGYNVEKPFLGSEWLIDKAVQAGIADKPTGSAAETTARIGMGFVNPAAAIRQAGKGIVALEKGIENMTLPVFRQITGNPNATKEQMMDFVLNQKEIMKAGAPAATRPGGTLMYGDDVGESLRSLITSHEGPQIKDPHHYPALDFIPKITKYMETQYGAPNDPLFIATIEGRFKPKTFYKPNSIFSDYAKPISEITDIPLQDGTNLTLAHIDKLLKLSKEGDEKARKIVAWGADRSFLAKGQITNSQVAEGLKSSDAFNYVNDILNNYAKYNKVVGFWPILKGEFQNNPEIISSMLKSFIRQKGVSITQEQLEPFTSIRYTYAKILEEKAKAQRELQTKDLLQKAYPMEVSPLLGSEYSQFEFYMTPAMKEEINRGKPVYKYISPYGKSFDVNDIFEFMVENNPEKWSKMSAPELIIAASSKDPSKVTSPTRIARMADEGFPLTPDQARIGTEKFMPVNSPSLGAGAEWREIVDKNGLRIEGGLMQHCLKRDAGGYCNRLLSKESKYFTLRDADGQPYVSIEMSKPIGQEYQNVPFSVIRQIKGRANENTMPLYGEEVSNFLEKWQSMIKAPIKASENPNYVPEKFRSRSFGLLNPENFRHGGMVDKPLYDRAA